MFYAPENQLETYDSLAHYLAQMPGLAISSVRQDIERGHSTLLIDGDNFVVCRIANEGVMWVDAAYGSWTDCIGNLEQIAKDCGCVEIAFESQRMGFMRKLKGTGYKPARVEYRKKLDG